MITGERVTLRPIRRSDISHFLKWFNDPEVIQYLSLYLPMTEMAEEKWIEELGTTRVQNTVVLVIEALDGNGPQPIGNVGLSNIDNKDHKAVFGIAIGEKDCWSSGYGTEAAQLILKYAFEKLNLHRVTSSAFAFNERSLRLHRKVGFTEEGRQRESVFKNGDYHDMVMFGLLKKDWPVRQRMEG